MSFLCPECLSPKSLAVIAWLELPPDSRSDEITLQIVECSRCGFAGLGVYEESRRGALGDESFDHTGYTIDKEGLEALKNAILSCPTPGERQCRCAAHRSFGQRDETGRWDGLAGVRLGNSFGIKL